MSSWWWLNWYYDDGRPCYTHCCHTTVVVWGPYSPLPDSWSRRGTNTVLQMQTFRKERGARLWCKTSSQRPKTTMENTYSSYRDTRRIMYAENVLIMSPERNYITPFPAFTLVRTLGYYELHTWTLLCIL